MVTTARRRRQSVSRNLRRFALTSPVGTLVARATSHEVIHCFGDSHVCLFRMVARRYLARTWCDINDVGGTTAIGLSNEDSRSGARRLFRKRISRLPNDRTLLFMLGEIDCGYLLWQRAEQGVESVEVGVRRSFENYTHFLSDLLETGRRSLIVVVVPLPVVIDYSAGQGLSYNRAPITATIEERTALTKMFNSQLRSWAASTGCLILDYEQETIDVSTGLVRRGFEHRDPNNHHYLANAFAPVLAQQLRTLGYG